MIICNQAIHECIDSKQNGVMCVNDRRVNTTQCFSYLKNSAEKNVITNTIF